MSGQKRTEEFELIAENGRFRNTAVAELLAHGDYETLQQTLYQALKAADAHKETTRANVLAAAYQICLSCSQQYQEIPSYKRAYEESVAREHALRQQLVALLKSIHNIQPDLSFEQNSLMLNGSENGIYPQKKTSPIVEKATEYWQKLQNFLPTAANDTQTDNAIMGKPTHFEADSLIDEKPNPKQELSISISPQQTKSVNPPKANALPEHNELPHQETTFLSLVVHCLGSFQVYLDDKPLGKWPSSKGKSIFKYLVNNRERPIAKEILMDLFWPDTDPDAARNNLNVAIYGLRQAFRNGNSDFSHVLYQDECYLLNPGLQIWLDVEEFMTHYQNGQRLIRAGNLIDAVQEYHAAEMLYQGEFLEEDRYEEWLNPLRQQLSNNYLELLRSLSQYYFDRGQYTSCITICRSMLAIDPCLEDAHCRLMRCHYHQGQQHLALRQYHHCVKQLKEELDVVPGPVTDELYEKIRCYKTI